METAACSPEEDASRRMPLRCVSCSAEAHAPGLRHVRHREPSGLVLDMHVCAQCRGRWLLGAGYRRAAGLADDHPVVPPFAMRTPTGRCPVCHGGLAEFVLPGTGRLVRGCRTCEGLWLDEATWDAWPGPMVAPAGAATGATTRVAPASAPVAAMTCPGCLAVQASPFACERCGLVFQKRAAADALLADAQRDSEHRLTEAFARLVGFEIRQRLEWLEILSPFERTNRYEVLFQGAPCAAGTVEERSRSWLNMIGRQLLGGCRPARLDLRDSAGQLLLTMDKPLRWYFHEIAVGDAAGQPLGCVRRVFHPLLARYQVCDAQGVELMQIHGPVALLPFFGHRYAFRRGLQDVGHVVKRWGGLVREAATDADGFRARLSGTLPWRHRALLFAAVLLIDFGVYEDNPSD